MASRRNEKLMDTIVEQVKVPTPGPTQARPSLLDFTAKVLRDMDEILVQRGGSYGDLADNTHAWVSILRILGFKFPPDMTDQTIGGILYITGKLSRVPASPEYDDNWLDIANYSALVLAMEIRRRQSLGLGPAPK